MIREHIGGTLCRPTESDIFLPTKWHH